MTPEKPRHDGECDHPHLIDGEFQSDKYPMCPRGKVPLSVKDKTAQDLLWQYAQRRRAVDAEFATDLEIALTNAGYISTAALGTQEGERTFWVVERFENGKSAGYWNGGHSRDFVADINEAIQFCRRTDAYWVSRSWHWTDTQLTEHIMLNNPASASQARTIEALRALCKRAAFVIQDWWEHCDQEPPHETRLLEQIETATGTQLRRTLKEHPNG